jgi:hypothetical protein
MKLKIVCDSFNPYFTDICKNLYERGFDIGCEFVNGYSHSDSLPFFESFRNSNSNDYIQIGFCELKNYHLNISAKKNILILNDYMEYDYSPYKFILDKIDHIYVCNSLVKNRISRMVEDKRKISVIEYYHQNVILKNSDKFVFKVGDSDVGNTWKLFASSFSRSFYSYNNIHMVINSKGNDSHKKESLNNLFGINNLNIEALDHISFTNNEHKSYCNNFDCYLSGGDLITDAELYDSMNSSVPIMSLYSDIRNDMIRSNTSYCINKIEDMSENMKKVFYDLRMRNRISKSAKQMYDKFISKEVMLNRIIDSIGLSESNKVISPKNCFYENGMDNIVL